MNNAGDVDHLHHALHGKIADQRTLQILDQQCPDDRIGPAEIGRLERHRRHGAAEFPELRSLEFKGRKVVRQPFREPVNFPKHGGVNKILQIDHAEAIRAGHLRRGSVA